MGQNISSAVMARRVEPPDSLDFFPTPPWATRALVELCLRHPLGRVWEPAAGEGHLAEVLREYTDDVFASDIHDYGQGYAVGSFTATGLGPDRIDAPFAPDWIITNPPFNDAEAFLTRALANAAVGVALLLRSTWSEGQTRFNKIFSVTPPSSINQFVERVPMNRGFWDPDGSTATAYAWYVFEKPLRRLSRSSASLAEAPFRWIPPGQRKLLTRPNDAHHFALEARMGGAILRCTSTDCHAAVLCRRHPAGGEIQPDARSGPFKSEPGRPCKHHLNLSTLT